MSRNKQFLIVGLVVVVVMFLGLALFVPRGGGGPCDKLFRYTEDGKASDAYALFSSSAKAKTSATAWTPISATIQGIFKNNQMRSLSSAKLTDTSTQVVYGVTKDGLPRVSCVAVVTNGQSEVDSLIINQ